MPILGAEEIQMTAVRTAATMAPRLLIAAKLEDAMLATIVMEAAAAAVEVIALGSMEV